MRIKSKLCVKFVWLFIVESKKQHLGADTIHEQDIQDII